MEDEAGVSLGDGDRLEVARSGQGRVEEFLAAGLLVERGEEVADAGRAVGKVGHEARKLRVLPPFQPAPFGDAELDQPQPRPDGQIARGGVVHGLGHVQEIEAGPGGTDDDVRDASPFDAGSRGLRGGVDQIAAADGGFLVLLVSDLLEDAMEGEADAADSDVEPGLTLRGIGLGGEGGDQSVRARGGLFAVGLVAGRAGQLQEEEDDACPARIQVRDRIEPFRPLGTGQPEHPLRRLDSGGVNPARRPDGGVEVGEVEGVGAGEGFATCSPAAALRPSEEAAPAARPRRRRSRRVRG